MQRIPARLTTLATLIAALAAGTAMAQTNATDVQRNVNQQKRIENGVQSGQLTTREAGRLERGQARISRTEARASADGHVGAGEQAHVQNMENRNSRRIYRQKHDAQTKG